MYRYKVRFVDVRNPFNPKLISRINFKDIDLILFLNKESIANVKSFKRNR